jgi:rhodanese-related sulfurtransferase
LPVGYPFRPEFEVTPRRVRDLLKSGGVYLIDCRSAEEVAAARIAGAEHIPMEVLAARVEEIEEAAGDRPIVVHCHMGGRSMKAALFLKGRGLDASSMAGGIELWAVDIDPKVPRY